MTVKEAEQVLELGSNYTEKDVKKNYKKLLRINHPDNKKNKQCEEEKSAMTRKLIEAYTMLLHGGVKKTSLEKFYFLNNEIKATEDLENRYNELPITSLPTELQMAIKENYAQYKQIAQITKLKLYNLETNNIMKSMEEYEKKYYNIRLNLTYCFFNYLEKNSSSLIYVKNTLHQKNIDEYCGDKFSPIIEDSLYEIIKKFLNYFPLFLAEKKTLQEEMPQKIIKELENITQKYKGIAKPEVLKEYDLNLQSTIERVKEICNVSPLQNIDTMAIINILKEYETLLANFIEGYELFLESRDMIIKELEENIKCLPDSAIREDLLEKSSNCYLIKQIDRFDLEISKIIMQLEKAKIALIPAENGQLKRILKETNGEK